MQFVMAIDRTGGSGSQARWGSLTETHRSSPFANNHLQSALVSYGLNPPRCSNKSIPCQSTEGPIGLEMVSQPWVKPWPAQNLCMTCASLSPRYSGSVKQLWAEFSNEKDEVTYQDCQILPASARASASVPRTDVSGGKNVPCRDSLEDLDPDGFELLQAIKHDQTRSCRFRWCWDGIPADVLMVLMWL